MHRIFFKAMTITLCVIFVTVLMIAGGFHILKQQKKYDNPVSQTQEQTSNNILENKKVTQAKTPVKKQKKKNTKTKKTQEELHSDELSSNEIKPDTNTPQKVSLCFAGDVYFPDYLLSAYEESGISGIIDSSLLQKMNEPDIMMVNQEFPFGTKGEPQQDKQYTFRIAPSYAEIFQTLGIDVVTLANNHTLDFGKSVLSETFETLNQYSISYIGAGDNLEHAKQRFETKFGNYTIGILAASRVIPTVDWNIENSQPGLLCTYDPSIIVEEIKKAHTECDFVVVYIHWGIERNTTPEQYERELARQYIDAGADLVIGSHPHVLQGIEFYNGKPIFYSLGNYIFNSTTTQSMLVEVLLEQQKEPIFSIIPCGVKNGIMQELSGEERSETLAYLEQLSFGVSIDENGVAAAN